MADPFDVPLPAIGAKPWTLNPAVEEVRDRIGSVDDIIGTGRLSPDGLEAELVAIAGELNPEALTDEFIAQQVSTPGTQTNADVKTSAEEVVVGPQPDPNAVVFYEQVMSVTSGKWKP